MNKTNNLTALKNNPKAIIRSMLTGGLIGLIIISLFVFTVDHPHPEWGKLWRIRPLIVTPLSGALGGLVFFSIPFMLPQSRWKKVLAIVLGLVVFVIGLWLGIVLGLAGTMWN